MKQKIRKIIVGIILIGILSLAVIAQTSGTWTQILPSGSGVNDVAGVGGRGVLITKTDGTMWAKFPDHRNFIQIGLTPNEGTGRISFKSNGSVYAIFTNRNTGNQALSIRTHNSWFISSPHIPNRLINDVSIGCNGIWISETTPTQNGVVSFSSDGGTTFVPINPLGPFNLSRISGVFNPLTGPCDLFAIDSTGIVWKFSNNQWTRTSASGMGDVAVSWFRRIWVAGKEFINRQPNGTIWYSDDDGVTWVKDPVAQGFQNIAVGGGGNDTLYAAGFNGSLWKWQR